MIEEMKKARCENCCGYLKPKLISSLFTLVVLALPFVREGTSRSSPLLLAIAHIKLGEFYPLLLIIFLAFYVYLVISLLVLFVAKVNGCPRHSNKSRK